MKSISSKLIISAFAFFSIMFVNAQSPITVHTVGDSSMSDYDESTTDKRGWAMMFQQFFTTDIVINNRAKSGASSKSFYLESAYWTTVKGQINPGDYVIIQFAHNDEKNGGLDGGSDPDNPINGTDYRGTSPRGTYKDYLKLYINETRALGATPILATSICRRFFRNGAITRSGRHDLGESYSLPEDNHTYDYSEVMRELAIEEEVDLIDLTTRTKVLVESYGATESATLFCETDSTHLNALGATLVARLCAQEMTSQNILTSYINSDADLLVTPGNGDFGDAYVGQTLTKEFTITGFDIEPTSGTFTLSVDNGFLIAADKTDVFESSIAMDYTGSNLEFSKFFISINQSDNGTKEGTLIISNGTISKEILLTANFVELSGGTEVNLRWELAAEEGYELTGIAVPVDQFFSGMAVNNYSVPHSTAAAWPDDENSYDKATKITQRNKIASGLWPAGEIDEVSTRYIEFGITASENTELNIDNISLYVGAAGGSGMSCRIYYSIDNFINTTVISEFPTMVGYQMYRVSATPVVKLSEGETLSLRIYPWYSIEKSGPLVCLSEVTIHGMATSLLSKKNIEKDELKWIVYDGYINVRSVPKNSNLIIYDLAGRLIFKSSENNEGEVFIKSPREEGVYIGIIESEEGVQATKFIVQ